MDMTETQAEELALRVRLEVPHVVTVEFDGEIHFIKVTMPVTTQTRAGETYEYPNTWQMYDADDWDWLRPRIVDAAVVADESQEVRHQTDRPE